MRDSTQAIQTALQRERGGVAIILCPDLGLRDWLATQVESLAPPDSHPFRTSDLKEVIASPTRMALLLPLDETAVVLALDGSRDRLLGEDGKARTQPVVLFLLREGDGVKAMTEAPSLASWVGGSDVDPEELAEIDSAVERKKFESKTGTTPEKWLVEWRAEKIPRTSDSFALAYWAMFLEEER